jgi:hypothetical protein
MSMMRSLCAVAGLAAFLAPGTAAGQSLLSARGLGYILEATDARSRGLGGITTGLPESRFSLENLAETAGLPVAGISATFHGDRITPAFRLGDGYETSRFPAIQVVFPFGERTVASIGYGAVLDQNWSVSRFDSLDLAGERRLVTDRFVSVGGVSRLRAGAGVRIHRRIDVGVGLDVYTGALRDSTVRMIDGLGGTVLGIDYRWRGLGGTAGARWRGDAVNVAAALSGGARLRAVPVVDTIAGEGSYAVPLRADVGASARIAQSALVAVSGRWTGWSATAGDVTPGLEVRDVYQGTAGVELEGLRLVGRPVPIRLGARLTQLPFAWGAAAAAPDHVDERALTAGVGIRFAGGAALMDVGTERGTRSSTAFDESFWRFSLSLSLLGR